MTGIALRPAPKAGRVIRRPVHTFNLKVTPFVIQPFMIAPVLPGDTMQHLLVQARTVTDPINNPLIGWWLDHYFFYVKLRDLDDRDTLTNMIVDPTQSLTSIDDTGDDPSTFYAGDVGYVNYVAKCRKRIVDCWFRDEPDVEATYLLNTDEPVAQIKGNSWLDSAIADDNITAVDSQILLQGDLAPGGTTDYVSAADVVAGIRAFQMAQMGEITQETYDDYLLSEGQKVKAEEEHRPELLRSLSSWSYPTNTIDPTNGAPRSAVSWAIADRADKKRFFKEPGFIIGLQVTRPKVYLGKQVSFAAMAMNTGPSWLPTVLSDDPASSLVKFAQGKGPLDSFADSNGYWMDVKDLLTKGDQFYNYTPDVTGATNDGALPLPSTTLQKRYPTDITWIEGLFVGGSAAAKVKTDGVVSLAIQSHVVDQFPTVQPRIGV